MPRRSIIIYFLFIISFSVIGLGIYSLLFNTESQGVTPILIDREVKIPENATKITPQNDTYKPSLHTGLFKEPIPLTDKINTAGAEDSPFITLDGNTLYFFFTPDPLVPAEEQLFDGVTGIWRSIKTSEGWSEAEYLNLTAGGLHLDGAPTVVGDELWFASAREANYKGLDVWIADIIDDKYTNIRNAGEKLNKDIGIGEFHVNSVGDEIFFHSELEGSKGGMDIWVTRLVNGVWSDPINIEEINSEENDGFPYLSSDGKELWFTRPSYGFPAIWMSHMTTDGWSDPRVMISNFAAEPTLDSEGNLYFCHHFISDGVMIEADIYYAERIKEPLEPIDVQKTSERGYLMGFLPIPSNDGNIEDAYNLAKSFADFVPIWGRPTPYYKLAQDLSGQWGELFLNDLVRDNGLIPIIDISFMGPNLTLAAPEDMIWVIVNSPFWRNSLRESVLEVVRSTRPLYLMVGNEVNRWYEKYGYEGDNGFKHFVSIYEEIYDAVKELSPQTKIFCSFARELVSEQREADMSVLNLFNPEKLDLVAFTSYPYSVISVNSPRMLPDDYYTRALNYLPGKSLALIEVGWSSNQYFGGEEAQSQYLLDLVNRLSAGSDLELLGWCWLSDLSETDSVGMFTYSGEEKLVWSDWKELFCE
ncbi:PD40 domain-containing protein [Candidatus Bathyarchaeota archaeon]|nr:PD40 domain-containing protein [Candidatus Bathyarchaeota archaeon]